MAPRRTRRPSSRATRVILTVAEWSTERFAAWPEATRAPTRIPAVTTILATLIPTWEFMAPMVMGTATTATAVFVTESHETASRETEMATALSENGSRKHGSLAGARKGIKVARKR